MFLWQSPPSSVHHVRQLRRFVIFPACPCLLESLTEKKTGLDPPTVGTPAENINDDILLEIFDACRVDNISPNTYPRNWWHHLAHVCQRWRRILFAFPIRLGITLVCNSRTPVPDVLASSPTLPLIIYWGNPGTLDAEDSVKNVYLALRHRDRVCRIKLRLPESSLRHVLTTSMEGNFPMLETLQLYCSSYLSDNSLREMLPGTFEAPNLRHLQISDSTLLPTQQSPLLNSLTSIVTFSIDEITRDLPPSRLVGYLLLMVNLKILKISQGTREVGRDQAQQAGQEVSRSLLTGLEELQYHGVTDYFEGLAALISAPSLERLSITFTNTLDPITTDSTTTLRSKPTALFQHLPTLISEAWDLRFRYARVRYRDGFSIAMDHNELWTGRGAFELRFNLSRVVTEKEIKLMAQICCLLSPMPSTVQSLLLEDGNINTSQLSIDSKVWHELLRPFDNVKTLRVAHRFVDEIDRSLQLDDKGGAPVLTLLPRLEEIVRYGSDKEFAAFVEARRVAGSSVRVVSGPKNRLTVV